MIGNFILRISYVKGQRLSFLSHLETVHAIERIIRRAKLPFVLTEGFNPHMKISFGSALPVGAGSECEYVDVRLKEYIKPHCALEMLKNSSTANLFPINCEYVSSKEASASANFPVSVWEAYILGASAKELKESIDNVIKRGFIEIKRKNKKPKNVELKDKLIVNPSFKDEQGKVLMQFVTCAQQSGSLRPDHFILAGLESLPNASLLRLTRTKQYSKKDYLDL